MPSRQQRRARERAPAKKRRKGTAAFVAVLTAVLLGGVGAAALLRQNPPEMTRGAIVGEHWHAKYDIHLCGAPLAPYPFVEGEVHSHGDGQIHIHPSTEALTNENANLGAFLSTMESAILTQDDERTFLLPDGTRFADGNTCVEGGETYELEVFLNDEEITTDPMELIVHNGDEVLIRFGPEPSPDAQPMPNPLTGPAGMVPPGGQDGGTMQLPPGFGEEGGGGEDTGSGGEGADTGSG